MTSSFNSDHPITTEKEDVFNRAPFIQTLYKEIESIPASESVVIGLSGKWGSGKTSVVNLHCEKLNTSRQNRALKPGDTIVVKFNPWNQIDSKKNSEEYFINSFFNAIKKQLWKDKDDWYIQTNNHLLKLKMLCVSQFYWSR